MDKQTILDQITFVESRIKELEKEILQGASDEKGRKELIEGYNKWVDRFNELIDKLNNLGQPDLETETLRLEQERLEFEKQKFEKEQKDLHRQEVEKMIFDGLELTVKIAVPVLTIGGALALAKLAYAKDSDLELCNGRIWGLLRFVTPKL